MLKAALEARSVVLSLAALLLAACGDESSASNNGSGGADERVVLLAERVQSEESRQIYVHLLSQLPSEAVGSRDRAYEFGNVDIYVHDERIYIFDREKVTLTRYRASADRELIMDKLPSGEDARLSFQSLGLPGFGFEHVFLSSTRAYLVDWGEYRVVVWDPSTMTITSTIDLSVAKKDGYVLSDSYLVSPVVADGKVLIAVYVWQDYAGLLVHPGTGVIVLDAETDADPVLIEDDRITGASKLFPTDEGRVLVVGDQYSGLYNHLGEDPQSVPPAGVLRIDPREVDVDDVAFEESYFVDLLDLTGSPGIYAAYQVDSENLLLQAWDPKTTVEAAIPDDYWYAPEYVYLLVDLKEKIARQVDSIPKASAGSVEQFRLDDLLYVQTYEEAEEDVNRGATVHRVLPDGVEPAFRIEGGDLWALKRVR